MVLQRMPWKERAGLAKRMRGSFWRGSKPRWWLKTQNSGKISISCLLWFFPTDLMSTSSGSLLTGNNMVGKDHFTKIDCISEVSRAINNWFLSFQEQNKLKFKNWAWMTICVTRQSWAPAQSEPGWSRGALQSWDHVLTPFTGKTQEGLVTSQPPLGFFWLCKKQSNKNFIFPWSENILHEDFS